MALIATIALVTSLGMTLAPQQTTQDYLQHLIGQRLILSRYAGSASTKAKESDLTSKKGGCDEAVEVINVDTGNASVRLTLRNIGTPFIRNKNRGCGTQPDMYSFTISDFPLDQSADEAKKALEHILQTPEAYLAASGITLSPPLPSGSQSPVNFPGPGLTAPKAVLSVTPHFSEANLPASIISTVTVRCVLGADGLLHDPVITRGLDEETNKRALAALAFWRLEPVRRSGLPIAAKIQLEFSSRGF